MKPRDLLLRKYQAVEPKLDNIRRATLAGLDEPRAERQPTCSRWQALLDPWRWHLAGLCAAWVVIGLLNLNRFTEPATQDVKPGATSAARTTLTIVRQNREQFRQLLESSAERAAPAYVPRPRGGLETTNSAV